MEYLIALSAEVVLRITGVKGGKVVLIEGSLKMENICCKYYNGVTEFQS